MKNGDAAYSLMREKSLGISDTDLDKVSYDNDDEFEEPESTSKVENVPVTASSGTISLSGTSVDGKVKLTWSLSDVAASMGFKVVVSAASNPVYPGNDYHYLSTSSTRSDVWSGLTAGKTYHFRVCEYLGGSCGVYSNDVSVTVTGTTTAATGNGTITLQATKNSEGKVILTWALNGMTSAKGFKVVSADHENPIYPGDNYHYYSDPELRADTWSGLSSGTYHFRVCEYLGGSCGVYSNDVSVSF
jgi:hypothetical protein